MKSPEQAAFKTILIIAVLIAIAVLPLAARADSHRPAPPAFTDFDTDGDGRVSAKEFDTLRAERIAANAAEGRQMRGLASAPGFGEVDTNDDGFLDEAEFMAGRQAHMAEMQKRRGQGQGGGHGGRHGQQGGHHGGRMSMPSFEDLDLDDNGCIDATEFAKHQASHHAQGRSKASEAQ
ncbi:MAG: hypothetical protein HKO85_01850 [Xanthomonadales bacterium]|nr:hypothetical protein [Gammaproteobacteria bacterium]NNL04003.1 hypothetical protein [Xanthomonadales bacterium]